MIRDSQSVNFPSSYDNCELYSADGGHRILRRASVFSANVSFLSMTFQTMLDISIAFGAESNKLKDLTRLFAFSPDKVLAFGIERQNGPFQAFARSVLWRAVPYRQDCRAGS